MKKLVLLITVALFSVTVNAQSIVQNLYSNVASGVKLTDTVTNAGTVTMSSAVVAGSAQNVTITATFTKLTGTVAGTATLLGSLNGTDWTSASATSYTVTDVASATTSWLLTNKPFQYYRVSVTGSGTSTYTVKGQVLSVVRK